MFIAHPIIRKSPYLLIIKLIILEILIGIIYALVSTGLSLFLSSLTLRIVFFIVVTIAEMACVLWLTLRWSQEYFIIGEQEIIHRRGVLEIKEESFSLANVQAVSMSQDVMGRIFNFGTIKFFSPVLKQEYFLADVPDPKYVKDQIEKSTNSFSTHKRSGELIIPIKNTK